jgi:hypothetical protein
MIRSQWLVLAATLALVSSAAHAQAGIEHIAKEVGTCLDAGRSRIETGAPRRRCWGAVAHVDGEGHMGSNSNAMQFTRKLSPSPLALLGCDLHATAVNHTPAIDVTPTLAARAHSPRREHTYLAAGATTA